MQCSLAGDRCTRKNAALQYGEVSLDRDLEDLNGMLSRAEGLGACSFYGPGSAIANAAKAKRPVIVMVTQTLAANPAQLEARAGIKLSSSSSDQSPILLILDEAPHMHDAVCDVHSGKALLRDVLEWAGLAERLARAASLSEAHAPHWGPAAQLQPAVDQRRERVASLSALAAALRGLHAGAIEVGNEEVDRHTGKNKCSKCPCCEYGLSLRFARDVLIGVHVIDVVKALGFLESVHNDDASVRKLRAAMPLLRGMNGALASLPHLYSFVVNRGAHDRRSANWLSTRQLNPDTVEVGVFLDSPHGQIRQLVGSAKMTWLVSATPDPLPVVQRYWGLDTAVVAPESPSMAQLFHDGVLCLQLSPLASNQPGVGTRVNAFNMSELASPHGEFVAYQVAECLLLWLRQAPPGTNHIVGVGSRSKINRIWNELMTPDSRHALMAAADCIFDDGRISVEEMLRNMRTAHFHGKKTLMWLADRGAAAEGLDLAAHERASCIILGLSWGMMGAANEQRMRRYLDPDEVPDAHKASMVPGGMAAEIAKDRYVRLAVDAVIQLAGRCNRLTTVGGQTRFVGALLFVGEAFSSGNTAAAMPVQYATLKRVQSGQEAADAYAVHLRHVRCAVVAAPVTPAKRPAVQAQGVVDALSQHRA